MTELAEILRQVKRIELRTKRLVTAMAAGRYRSAFRGQGMEFDDVREYSPGEDVRTIDWNVTARAGRPWVKVYREERELTTFLLVDASASMRFGAIPGISPRSKVALAAEAAAIIAVAALRNQDRIGLVLFSDHTDLHLPARKGRGHALRLVREVLTASERRPQRGTTDLPAALRELARVARRRCVVFLISDFLPSHADTDLPGALAQVARRHDLVGLRIADPAESSLPSSGIPLAVEDPESHAEMVVRSSRGISARYARAWQEARQRTRDLFRAGGCDLVDLATDAGALQPLLRFFRDRRPGRHG